MKCPICGERDPEVGVLCEECRDELSSPIRITPEQIILRIVRPTDAALLDPWGRVLAEGGIEPGVIMAEIDPAQVAAARGRIPSLQHGRRFEVIEPLAEPARLHIVEGAR